MAELTFKSPGVSTREIDLSGPTALGPQGTPAGIIGTALKGRAFVPITVATYQDFVAEFGSTDGEKFGPLAMNEWMRNARAGTYVRVLGVGDGKQRNSGTGVVANAGFVVGERLVKENGLIGSSRSAISTAAGANPFAIAPIDGGASQTGSNDQFTFTDTGDNEERVVIAVESADHGAGNKARVTISRDGGADPELTTITISNNTAEAGNNATIATLVEILAGNADTATLTYMGGGRLKAGLTVAAKAGVDAAGAVVAHAGVTLDGGPEDDRPQPLGRMNFLCALMRDANTSGLLLDSGIQHSGADVAAKATITVTNHANIAATETTIAFKAVNGTVDITLTAHADTTTGGDTDTPTFQIDGGSNAQTATHIAAALNANAHLAATADGAVVTVTQADAGRGGNQPITLTDPGASGLSKTDFSGGTDSSAGVPVLRAAIMAADGVVISLSAPADDGGDAATVAGVKTSAAGRPPAQDDNTGDADIRHGAVQGVVTTTNGKQSFTMFLNGHVSTGLHPSVIKLSLDPADPAYISRVLNTDPTKIREAGHYLYAHWDVHPDFALPTSVDVATGTDRSAVLLVGAAGRNTGSATQPNFENFEERFRTARTTFFMSQDFGAGNKNLFRVHALDDGASANDLFKITIENISASSNENNKFGKFDLVVRGFYDNDSDPVVLEAYRGVNLDRSSENYIARRVGDQHAYYDFDQRDGAQKLRIEGAFSNRSRYIRVEMHSDVIRGALPAEALPVGFRGAGHLSLDGTNSLAPIDAAALGGGIIAAELNGVKMLPVPMRRNVAQGLGNKKRSNADLCWGVQFERLDSVTQPNKATVVDESIASFTKFFPDHRLDTASAYVRDNEGASNVNGAVVDSDLYNNNMFTLERVQVVTGSNDRPVVNEWAAAAYRRDGAKATLTSANGATHDASDTRFLDPAKDFTHLPSRKYLKFTTFLQGGFDGLNIFDKEKSELSDVAARREFGEGANQGGVKGSTIAAYRKAIDVMEEKADVEIQLLAIPGLRHPSITDYAVDSVENRFDAMLLMDIEEKDQINEFVTGSSDQLTNVTYTVNNFESRNLDSSFAAAYFPDVVIADPATGANVKCPPSVAVLGAFSLNDSVSHPWFAPAGFTRGALSTVLESQVKLKRANLDALYEADINPITSFPHTPGVVVFGQKTLQAAQSALDRVNVRRLLIDIRRKVKKIAQSLLFEPNRVDTLARFSNLVNPVMQQIQAQQGLDRYKVQIDTSTTTQADVENNTIRGKIFLQPTRSLEFISLDFVVTNQGAEI